jgi:allophanate hydrolase subunit 2
MSVTVLKPGLLTTLQDAGRRGCAALGVGSAGPMDDVAFRLANALVGNDPDATALEMTLLGPRLHFDEEALIAFAGADFDTKIGASALPAWRPLRIAAGSVLDCGHARRGTRGYLAIAGSFAVERVLGSAATDVNARIGPFGGRALASSDVLSVGSLSRTHDDVFARHTLPAKGAFPAQALDAQSTPRAGNAGVSIAHPALKSAWSLDPRPWFDADPTLPIRLIRGTHFDALDAASHGALFDADYRIGADSNRTGFRLDGPRLALVVPLELVSEPVAFGTLQLPPGGQPIALMAEHPTVGGYPRIGQVAAIDLPRLAQRRPGETLHFCEIGLDEAQTRYLARERELASMIAMIDTRLGE